MGDEPSSDVAASDLEDEGEDPSITAVADEPAVTRERAPEVKPGDLLAGRYQIEAVLGKGGSGVVLRAYDRVSASVVAVKVLKPGLTHDPRWEKRFQRELRLGRPVRHPNVCRIFDIGDSDGYRFLTMEYATGGTLRDLIKKISSLRPLAERLADAAGAIAGLAAIHGAGIVHRDVKPDNMLRMDDGRLVLSDFGLATDLPDSTMVSVFVGTPHYMAPEVREGDPATTRSDVWSLGVVLHEIFFGKRPDKRSGRSVSGVSKTSTTSTSSTLERAMLALCTRCLADDPADRPEDARAVEKLFDGARRSPYAILRSPRRRLLSLVSIAVTAAAVAGGLGLRTHWRNRGAGGVASPGIPRLFPSGEPTDWSKSAQALTRVSGHVHCFSITDGKSARLIWGTPRRAEDIDLQTGRRTAADLLPETYQLGCPSRSGRADEILYTRQNTQGAKEVWLSKAADGREGIHVTPGFDPIWLSNGEGFLYSIDAGNAAAFSLSTMTFSLLPDPGLGGHQMILDKIASSRTETVAVLFGSSNAERAVAIYEGRSMLHGATFVLPGGREIQFDGKTDDILVSHQLSSSISSIARLTWRTGSFVNLGRSSGLDLMAVQSAGEHDFILGRHRSMDVWYVDGAGMRRLTSDGENFSAAMSAAGDLLLGKRTTSGALTIWLQQTSGAAKQLTTGPLDVAPEFSPDGSSWAYADYDKKNIMLCSTAGRSCKVLRHDELLPSWPRFSPDGKKVAFVTQVSPARLTVIDLQDGTTREIGVVHGECAPVWASPTELWSLEGARGHHAWVERNAATGAKTGSQRAAATNLESTDQNQCLPASAKPGSPFFRPVRIETDETSTLLRL